MISGKISVKRKIGWIAVLAVLSIFPQTVSGQVRFRPRLFLGLGLRRALDTTIPTVEMENEFGEVYYNINLSSPDVVGGAGRFFGQSKNFRYVYKNYQDNIVTKVVSQAEEYEGWAAFFGMGAVIFR